MFEQLTSVIIFFGALAGLLMTVDLLSSDDGTQRIFIREARKIAGDNRDLNKSIDDFITNSAPRESKEEFLSSLRKAATEEKIQSIYLEAGIANPSGADRLMAMQIVVIQEQNEILKKS